MVEKHFKKDLEIVKMQVKQSNIRMDQNHDPALAIHKSTTDYVRPLLEYFFDLTPFYNISVPFILDAPKSDWHGYDAMEKDSKRVGLGEHAIPAYIHDDSKKQLQQENLIEYEYNILISDLISVNRSLPDIRKKECHHKQYLANLPSISVVIPVYNEYLSVLLRSIHSIKNRTPPELLREIILVDDNSDREFLKKQLDDHVANNFKDLVKIIRLPERMGLIRARLAGARKATGDVLVFFDSHIECNYNWLPPLLEPIAINKRIVACPIVDGILYDTFAYYGETHYGSRGGFRWPLTYQQMGKLPADSVNITQPFRSPVMFGGLFAISRDFFWELGGYDEGLKIWGAEQFELSFKIWMCGGLMCDIPCSRVGHLYRGPMNDQHIKYHKDITRNKKRVAEVWMDEYAKYVYEFDPEGFANVDFGDLTAQIELRKHLKCKSFKWFLEEIAPDILKNYPPVWPSGYASGVIQSLFYPHYCLDTLNGAPVVGLFECAANKTHPQISQIWTLSDFRDIHIKDEGTCLDVFESHENSSIWLLSCHKEGVNQFWSYDLEHQMIAHGTKRTRCIEAFVENGQTAVYVNACDKLNPRMKWTFGTLNETALNDFWNGVDIE